MNRRETRLRRRPSLLTLSQVSERCRLHQDMIRWFVRQGLIEPWEQTEDLFPPEVTARLQKILRLHRDLNVNYDGIALVLELLERIEVLEARLDAQSARRR